MVSTIILGIAGAAAVIFFAGIRVVKYDTKGFG